MEDTRNVVDKYKGWTEDLIRKDVKQHTFPYSVCMLQLQGDFNFGTVVRNANAFGAQSVFYVGQKRWDRRGAVGTHHYTDVIHYDSWLDFAEALNPKVSLIALEQSDKSWTMSEFCWPTNSCLIIGEENAGLPAEVLEMCDLHVEIPMYGSVRSLNAGVASGIAMNDYVTKYLRKNND